jgi:hypothetical protein
MADYGRGVSASYRRTRRVAVELTQRECLRPRDSIRGSHSARFLPISIWACLTLNGHLSGERIALYISHNEANRNCTPISSSTQIISWSSPIIPLRLAAKEFLPSMIRMFQDRAGRGRKFAHDHAYYGQTDHALQHRGR